MDDTATPNYGKTLTRREQVVDELARRYEFLKEGQWQRNTFLFLTYVSCGLFGNMMLMLFLAAIQILAETIAVRMERGLDPFTSPYRYVATVGLVVVRAACIGIAISLTWLVDSPYSKILATGFGFLALLQISSVRAVHLRYSHAGLATLSAILLALNTMHWLAERDISGFLISTFTGVGMTFLAVWTMRANYALHTSNAHALAQARASDAAKSLFLAQMSHELRTPLNAIIGLGEIEAAKATGPSRDRLQTLLTSARGLAEVLDDVLDLSAINTGQLTLVPRASDLRAVLTASAAIAGPKAPAAADAPILTVADSVPDYAYLDAQRLRQCLTNLISNALKHAGGQGIQISADYRDGQLAVDVIDSGPGVVPELAETLFEPLRRGSVERPGLGLGLAISRDLARRMGGDLYLVPSATGAVFRLEVPAPACPPPPEAEPLDLTGRRILVVDDVATNRLVAEGLLGALGAKVTGVASGADALKLMAETEVDLVLLDMAMPDLNGFETFRRLREIPGKRVPVIAMTAGAMPDQRSDIQAAGMDGFLAKPILPEAIAPALGPHLAPRA